MQLGACGRHENQVAGLLINAHPPLSFERQPNALGPGVGMNYKVILQIAAAAIKNQIHAVVNVGDADSSVVGDLRQGILSIFSVNVIADAAGGIQTFDSVPSPGTWQSHVQRTVSGSPR